MDWGTLIKPLLSAYGFVRKPIKKALAERKAGQDPFSVPSDTIEPFLDDALRRLGAVSETDPVWKQVGIAAVGLFVRPQEFNKPHIRQWLSEERVRRELKSIVRAKLGGAALDPSSRKTLVTSYTEISWESERHANAVIETAIAFLQASIQAGTADTVGAGIAQAGFSKVHRRFDKIEDALEHLAAEANQDSPAVAEHHRVDASEVLRRIVRRR